MAKIFLLFIIHKGFNRKTNLDVRFERQNYYILVIEMHVKRILFPAFKMFISFNVSNAQITLFCLPFKRCFLLKKCLFLLLSNKKQNFSSYSFKSVLSFF